MKAAETPPRRTRWGPRAERGAARANGGYVGRGPGTQKRPRGRPGEPVGGCGAEGRRPVGLWGLPGPRGGSRGRPRGAPEARPAQLGPRSPQGASRPGLARQSKPARSDVSPAPPTALGNGFHVSVTGLLREPEIKGNKSGRPPPGGSREPQASETRAASSGSRRGSAVKHRPYDPGRSGFETQ